MRYKIKKKLTKIKIIYFLKFKVPNKILRFWIKTLLPVIGNQIKKLVISRCASLNNNIVNLKKIFKFNFA